MKEKVYKELHGILNELMIPGADNDIRADAVLLGRGGIMDSLTAAQLIARVDRLFDVDIVEDDPDLACCETLNALAEYITERMRR